MKIAIDFREAAKPTRAGKGEYIFQLVKALIRLQTDDQLILLVEPHQNFSLPAGRWTAKAVPWSGLFWHLWVAGWLEFCRPIDLYFSPTSVIVPTLVRSVKVITILHDFTVWRFPAYHFSKAIMIERWLMPLTLRASNHLVAISQFTRQEAISLFKVPDQKLTIVPAAKGEQFSVSVPTPATISALQTKYHLPNKFLLYLGTIEPRKNIKRLIAAFQAAVEPETDTSLVLAGGRGWSAQQLLADAGPRVITTGYIDDSDRPLLYNLALALVFPSLYEGFGLPPLEAMACGTPVITSRTASLPEVVGDAALLVDPTNTAELTQAIRQLLSSPQLREELRQKGLIQAQKFTWAISADITHRLFHTYD